MSNQWKQLPFRSALAGDVPNESGVYVIADIRRVISLPVDVEIVYVGKSKRLRRRFREHALPWRETNSTLRDSWRSENREFWFLRIPENNLDDIERHLIREIKPTANSILYGQAQ